MTPEQKAKQLIEKFYNLRAWEDWDDAKRKIAYGIAAQSAVVAVVEIIPCTWKLETYKKWGFIDVAEETTTEYWNKVLDELTKQAS